MLDLAAVGRVEASGLDARRRRSVDLFFIMFVFCERPSLLFDRFRLCSTSSHRAPVHKRHVSISCTSHGGRLLMTFVVFLDVRLWIMETIKPLYLNQTENFTLHPLANTLREKALKQPALRSVLRVLYHCKIPGGEKK